MCARMYTRACVYVYVCLFTYVVCFRLYFCFNAFAIIRVCIDAKARVQRINFFVEKRLYPRIQIHHLHLNFKHRCLISNSSPLFDMLARPVIIQ